MLSYIAKLHCIGLAQCIFIDIYQYNWFIAMMMHFGPLIISHNNSFLIYDSNINSEFICNYSVPKFCFESNTKSKNPQIVQIIIEWGLKNGITPDSRLIAMGGGTLIDTVGFVASILFRGIAWTSVPTTILAQIDAGIGGKVAIDLLGVKNLIGNFHLPSEIFINPQYLESIPIDLIKQAQGELLKYALLSQKIAKLVLVNASKEQWIQACAYFKQSIVDQDLYDKKDIRIQLNLGHTFGHVFEKLYNLPHGIAVLYGLEVIIQYFADKKVQEYFKKLKKIYNINIDLNDVINSNTNWENLTYLLSKDKKNNYKKLRIIVPTYPEGYYIKEMEIQQCINMIKIK